MKPDAYTRPNKPKFLQCKRREWIKAPPIQPIAAPVLVPAGTECFTTPAAVVDRMIQAAGIMGHHSVLEPSAGTGAIVRRLPEHMMTTVYEISPTLCDVLRGLEFDARPADFLTVEPGAFLFDRVLMNPPFSNLQDVAHVRHAFKFLKPGGRLVAIMSPSWRHQERTKAREFRTWFEQVGGEVEELPADSFKSSGTSVNTVMVVINKLREHV